MLLSRAPGRHAVEYFGYLDRRDWAMALRPLFCQGRHARAEENLVP